MPIEELDELVNSFSEADRQAARDLIARNPEAQTLLNSQQTVYRAFVDGDTTKLGEATANEPPAAAAQPPAAGATSSPALDLASLDAHLGAWAKSNIFGSPEFNTAVEARATEIATQQLNSALPKVIGRGAEIANDLYKVRAGHVREFGDEIDEKAFMDFYAKEGPKHGNRITETYDSFVQDKRIEARVKKGVEQGLAKHETDNVPGTSLPASGSPLRNFIDFNVQKAGGKAPSADADDAARAFGQMRSGWAN